MSLGFTHRDSWLVFVVWLPPAPCMHEGQKWTCIMKAEKNNPMIPQVEEKHFVLQNL